MNLLEIKKSANKHPKLIWGVLVCLSIIIIGSIFLAICKQAINPDATYYIGVSRLLLDGKTPFVDFFLHYTPLSFYLMCIPISIFGSSFTTALCSLYSIHIANSFIIYKICRKERFSKEISLGGAIYNFVLCFLHEGNCYVLEPFVLLFGLLAILLTYRKNVSSLVLSGICCSFAFFCKQYGLGFLFLCLALVLTKEWFSSNSIKDSIKIIIGFISGCLIVVGILAILGVGVENLINFSGSDYHRNGFSGLVAGVGKFITTIPILLSAIAICCIKFKQLYKNPLFLLGLFGIGGFLLQCYVRNYLHYKMLSVPFVIFLVLACMREIKNMEWNKYLLLLNLVLLIVPGFLFLQKDYRLCQTTARIEQQESADNLMKLLPEKSENVFVSYDLLPIAYLTQYFPPLIEKYGMSNGFVDTKEGIADLLSAASSGIISDDYLNNTKLKNPELYNYIVTNYQMSKVTNQLGQTENWVLKRK